MFVDEDAFEDGLVELSPLGFGCCVVSGVAVSSQVDGSGDGLVDAGGLLFGGGEGGSCGLDLGVDAGLFGFEEFEWDGVGVVGLEEFGAFGFEPANELLGLGALCVEVVLS